MSTGDQITVTFEGTTGYTNRWGIAYEFAGLSSAAADVSATGGAYGSSPAVGPTAPTSLASELVSREVFATRGVKPILCSFSDLAASGGYFVAAGCDVIYAEPMTITGSIGIFYGKFDIGGLARKLGITTDTFKRGKRADLESMFRPYTDDERAVLKDKLRYMYGRFVSAVSEGRGITKDEALSSRVKFTAVPPRSIPATIAMRLSGANDTNNDRTRRAWYAECTAH